MWKKKLILFVTFIAGLYYFLEFMLPPTMPGSSTAGIVKSITVGKPDAKTNTSSVAIELVQFDKTIKLPVSKQRKINAVIIGVPTLANTTELKAKDRVTLDDGKRGVVTAVNNAVVKVGILGSTKIINTTVTAGKSKILAFWIQYRGGGEGQVDDISKLVPDDLITRIGPTTYLSGYMTEVNNFFIVLGTMSWGYAIFSLWMIHTNAIKKRTKEWFMSVLFFLGLAIGLFAGSGYGIDVKTPIAFDQFRLFMNDTVSLYIGFAFYSATFSILSFYLASAAYRSFKAKSREAVLMMVSALVVMLGQIPFGLYLTSWIPVQGSRAWLPTMSSWLQLVLNTAVVRGIWFGMMLAAMAIGLRFWLSLERGAFFDREL